MDSGTGDQIPALPLTTWVTTERAVCQFCASVPSSTKWGYGLHLPHRVDVAVT